MKDSQTVPETDVLIATIMYLFDRGLYPYQVSIPRGKGIDTESTKRRISDGFKVIERQPLFSNEGADIIAISEKEWWHIECKGTGSGKAQTQRNNFDRALASVASYFGEDKKILPEQFHDVEQYLGLALPTSSHYLKELKRRVRKPLREILNLWVLLYDPQSKSIRNIPPNSDY